MKTRFILHGGMTSEINQSNKTFFQEFVKDLADGSTVLYIPFARNSVEEQTNVYIRDLKLLRSYADKKLSIVQAEPSSFTKQLEAADAIFITGGTTSTLKQRLADYPEFKNLIKGKTIAGSSAGANIFSKFHTSGFSEGIQEGLGILPICIMAHFGNPEFNATEDNVVWFEPYLDKYSLLRLPECEWKVVETE